MCGHIFTINCGKGDLDIIVTNSNLGNGLDLYKYYLKIFLLLLTKRSFSWEKYKIQFKYEDQLGIKPLEDYHLV